REMKTGGASAARFTLEAASALLEIRQRRVELERRDISRPAPAGRTVVVALAGAHVAVVVAEVERDRLVGPGDARVPVGVRRLGVEASRDLDPPVAQFTGDRP